MMKPLGLALAGLLAATSGPAVAAWVGGDGGPVLAPSTGGAGTVPPSYSDVATQALAAAQAAQAAANAAVASVQALGNAAATATALGAEVIRAQAAENANATAVTAERARAQGAEQAASSAASAAQTTANAAAPATSLASEVTRATGAEGTNATAIGAETTRAQGQEGSLSAAIAAEAATARNASNLIGGAIPAGVIPFGTAHGFAVQGDDLRIPANVASVAALRALPYYLLADQTWASVAGYNAGSTLGGGSFLWSATSTAADDGGTVLNPTGNTGAGRWLRFHLSTAFDVRWFGAVPSGSYSFDNAAPINATMIAVDQSGYKATPFWPPGKYHIKNPVTLASGQCAFAFGRSGVTLSVGSDFNPGASYVVSMGGGAEQSAPCLRGIAIVFDQPTPLIVTATAAAPAGTSTVTVSDASKIVTGDYLYDASSNQGFVSQLNLVTAVSGNTVSMTVPFGGNGIVSGDVLHLAPSRARFATLGNGCTTAPGGTGCQYPWAISFQGSNRVLLDDLFIAGAWNGIDATGGGGSRIRGVEMGALNVGLNIDAAYDSVNLDDYHPYAFGFAGSLGENAYYDGQVTALQIGRVDGLVVSGIVPWQGNIVFTANATNSQDDTKFDGVSLDGGTISIPYCSDVQLGGTSIRGSTSTKPLLSVGTAGSPACHVFASDIVVSTTDSQPVVTVAGGSLRIANGRLNSDSKTVGVLSETGGTVSVVNTDILDHNTLPVGVPLVAQTGGAITLVDDSFATGSGLAVSIGADNTSNYLGPNLYGSMTVALPAGVLAGIYNTGTVFAPPSDPTSIQVGAYSFSTLPANSNDTAFGVGACGGGSGAAYTANANDCHGWHAGYLLTTGSANEIDGAGAMSIATTATQMVAIGRAAGAGCTSCAAGVILGYGAGKTITTANRFLEIGNSVGQTTCATGTDFLLLGTDANTDCPSASSTHYVNVMRATLAGTTNTTAAPAPGGIGSADLAIAGRLQTYGPLVDASCQSVVLSGTAYTVPANTSCQRLKPTATVASQTIVLPTAVVDGEAVEFDEYAYALTALTLSPAVPGWSNGSTLAANGVLKVKWDAGASAWQRVQ